MLGGFKINLSVTLIIEELERARCHQLVLAQVLSGALVAALLYGLTSCFDYASDRIIY